MSGCLLSCGLDGAKSQLEGWIYYWRDGDTTYCEVGCELYLMHSHADGCMRASNESEAIGKGQHVHFELGMAGG